MAEHAGRTIRPMKAVAADEVPVGEGWSYEIKWDGMRLVAFLDHDGVRLQSSNGNGATNSFPELEALSELLVGFDSLILDGEVVAMNDTGIPDFGRLQHRMHVQDRADALRRAVDVPVSYAVFDVLGVNGDDTLRLPLRDRRSLLDQIVEPGSHWLLTESHSGDPAALLDVVLTSGLEGLIAKRLDSLYEEGKRSRSWIKVKPRMRQEFVVGGWSEGRDGNTGSLGSLLLGVMEGPKLVHCGSVGSGLRAAQRREWKDRLTASALDSSPFDNEVDATGGRRFRWCEPKAVVEVAFHDWSEDGYLRHPVYLGTRTDKAPEDVVREITSRSSARDTE